MNDKNSDNRTFTVVNDGKSPRSLSFETVYRTGDEAMRATWWTKLKAWWKQ